MKKTASLDAQVTGIHTHLADLDEPGDSFFFLNPNCIYPHFYQPNCFFIVFIFSARKSGKSCENSNSMRDFKVRYICTPAVNVLNDLITY